MAQAPRQRGTGFIDFGRYLSANRPQAEAMAGKIADPIEKAGQGVLTDLETAQGKAATNDTMLEGAAELGTRASDVAKKAWATGSIGGLAAGIQDFTPKTSTYGVGMNLLDAGLTGAAGGERFQGLRDRYSGLFGRVTDAAKQAQEAAARPKPPPAAAVSPVERREDVYVDRELEKAKEAQRQKRLDEAFTATPGRRYDYSPIFGTRGGGRG